MYNNKKQIQIVFLIICAFSISGLSLAQDFDPAVDGLIQNQQRQTELEKITQPQRDVLLEQAQNKSPITFQEIEDQNCFPIHQVKLNGDMSIRFEKYLKQTLKGLEFKDGLCMGGAEN
ncbi:hypothetical protein [Acinetobacter sp. ANC 4558]|uniref:hypothetical protein n=1 Tax=Acinetobacter sp. ANC 4558 TaxID=1977876 RepID=UPI001BB468EF|nr:hypothetical protein [Acinetobacter sp. ANC 4558]